MAHIDITTSQQFQTDVLGSDKLSLVDFWAEWCGPCRMVEPIYDELAKQYEGKATFTKLDVDALPEVANEYAVQSIPTMIFFLNGKEVSRLIGAHPAHDYESEINKYL